MLDKSEVEFVPKRTIETIQAFLANLGYDTSISIQKAKTFQKIPIMYV